MSEEYSFLELIRRVRKGDETASAELVRRYEPAIRVAVHVRLRDPRLRRLFDSTDICQSVLGNFFARVANGEFRLEAPDHLIRLLVTMARNRLVSHALKEQAARRDTRRTQSTSLAEAQTADPGDSPSTIVSHQELQEAARQRLSSEERLLAEKRALGKSWNEIAAELGSSPDRLRMQLRRAFTRIAGELRLDCLPELEAD
jgi:RNA polymerase sigma factor (sigma-70 family)